MENKLMIKEFRAYNARRDLKTVTADDPDTSMCLQIGVIVGMLTFTLVYLIMTI